MLGNPFNPLGEFGWSAPVPQAPVPLDATRLQQSRRWQMVLGLGACGTCPCLHCWHPFSGAWAGSQPPPVSCCWCGLETYAHAAVPQAHGPYAGGR